MNRREALKQSAWLMGYGVAGSVFGGMLNGCQVDTGSDWTPLFFTPAQAATVAEVAEHILPRTDTPGAKDVFVDRFIDRIIADCYSPEQQEQFRSGLDTFDADCRQQFNRSFVKCTPAQRDEFLRRQEAAPSNPDRYLWGNKIVEGGKPPFYRELKGLCLFGYFSSEEVGEKVLKYDPVPGKFVGCVPVAEIGRAWSL